MIGSKRRPSNMNEICRLCLTDDGSTTPIFGEDESSHETQIPLSFRIMACVSVEVSVSDGLPTLICRQCLNHVNSWHEFKQICDSSQATLKEWHKQIEDGPFIEKEIVIKQEPLDEETEVELEDVLDITTECDIPSYMVDYIKQEVDVADESTENISVQSTHDDDPLSFSVECTSTMISPGGEGETEVELVPEENETAIKISDIKTESADAMGGENLSGNSEGRVLRSVKRRARVSMYSKKLPALVDDDSPDEFKVKPFACKICDKSFSYNYLLKRHQKTHTGDRNVCVYCQKGFSSHASLMQHLKMFVGNSSKPFSCENCRFEFSCKSQYLIHADMYAGGTCTQTMKNKKNVPKDLGNFCKTLFNCALCEVTFPSQLMLRLHMKKDHLHYSCTKCHKTYTNGVALSNHMRSHSIVPVNFKCSLCKKKFLSQEALRKHKKIHIEQRSIPVTATPTENIKKTQDELPDTGKNMVSESETTGPHANNQQKASFKCATCPECFNTPSALKFHMKHVHRQYACHRCSKLFTSAVSLSNHLRCHSMTSFKTHRCRICMKTFSSVEVLTKHRSTHYSSQKSSKKLLRKANANNTSSHKLNMFSCPICHVLIRYVESVEKHLRLIHSVTEESELKTILEQTLQSVAPNVEKDTEKEKEKITDAPTDEQNNDVNTVGASDASNNESSSSNFTCNICNKSLANKHMLATHMKLIHMQVPTYKCHVCSRVFAYKSYLVRHSKIHHGKGSSFSVMCGICFKKFPDEKTLNNHKGVHTRFKHFSCDTCRKSFNGINAWQKHQRMHQKGLIYSCKLCGKKFMSRADLHEHKRMHIKLKIYSCTVCKNSYHSSSALGKHKRRHGHYPINGGSENSESELVIADDVGASDEVVCSTENSSVTSNKFFCDVCNKSFFHIGALKKHMTVHTKSTSSKSSTSKANANNGSKEYVCTKCNREFGDPVSLIRHKGWHTRRPDLLDTSNEDNSNSKASESVRISPCFVKLEPNTVTVLKCEKCKKTFTTSSALEIHEKTHVVEEPPETKSPPYISDKAVDQPPVVLTTQRRLACKICRKPFESKKALITHIGWHSRDHTKKSASPPKEKVTPEVPKETFVCNVCHKSFSSVQILTKHKKLHTRKLLSSIKAKPDEKCDDNTRSGTTEFVCSVCARVFKCQKYLDIHMRMHTGEKRFKCNLCPQAYTRSGSLWKHKRMHHAFKLFSCPICQKRFGLRVQLTKHMANHNMSEDFLGHSQNLVPCSFCDKVFAKLDNLRQHEKTHHGIR